MEAMAEKASGEISEPSHLFAIDGLRAICALFVVVHHSYLNIWPILYGVNPDSNDSPWVSWAVYGHFAVTIFIAISGFVLTLPLVKNQGRLKGGVWGFYKGRFRRVVLPYYLS